MHNLCTLEDWKQATQTGLSVTPFRPAAAYVCCLQARGMAHWAGLLLLYLRSRNTLPGRFIMPHSVRLFRAAACVHCLQARDVAHWDGLLPLYLSTLLQLGLVPNRGTAALVVSGMCTVHCLRQQQQQQQDVASSSSSAYLAASWTGGEWCEVLAPAMHAAEDWRCLIPVCSTCESCQSTGASQDWG
jgi:hypothetical protein